MKILILKIILRKLQNSKKISKIEKILRMEMLLNTGPGAWKIQTFTNNSYYLSFGNKLHQKGKK